MTPASVEYDTGSMKKSKTLFFYFILITFFLFRRSQENVYGFILLQLQVPSNHPGSSRDGSQALRCNVQWTGQRNQGSQNVLDQNGEFRWNIRFKFASTYYHSVNMTHGNVWFMSFFFFSEMDSQKWTFWWLVENVLFCFNFKTKLMS